MTIKYVHGYDVTFKGDIAIWEGPIAYLVFVQLFNTHIHPYCMKFGYPEKTRKNIPSWSHAISPHHTPGNLRYLCKTISFNSSTTYKRVIFHSKLDYHSVLYWVNAGALIQTVHLQCIPVQQF